MNHQGQQILPGDFFLPFGGRLSEEHFGFSSPTFVAHEPGEEGDFFFSSCSLNDVERISGLLTQLCKTFSKPKLVSSWTTTLSLLFVLLSIAVSVFSVVEVSSSADRRLLKFVVG